jgi:hypothetical protein
MDLLVRGGGQRAGSGRAGVRDDLRSSLPPWEAAPATGECQSFLPNGWRGDAKPPVEHAGGDNHRSRGERAAVREPQLVSRRAGGCGGRAGDCAWMRAVHAPRRSPTTARRARIPPYPRPRQQSHNCQLHVPLDLSSPSGRNVRGPGFVSGAFRVRGLCSANEGQWSLRRRITAPLRGGVALP